MITQVKHTIKHLWFLLLAVQIVACQQSAESTLEEHYDHSSELYYPQEALGQLFHDVQMQGIFSDSKTFVDCNPKIPVSEIIDLYRQKDSYSRSDLEEFVYDYFEVPHTEAVANNSVTVPIKDHLNTLWNSLRRKQDDATTTTSLLPLPHPYVVPGGRFREIYYWDSYFTMLGLLESGQDSLMLNMIRNFSHLIETYGFIPNGNRTYYLGRSQPPFFSAMVMLWADHYGLYEAVQFLPQIKKEYEFWMEGVDKLDDTNNSYMRLVRFPDGTLLNRYWDNLAQPRPESYKEDFEQVQAFPENMRAQVYRDLRAGAESGWDYSSRWFSDGESLDSIITTQIVPVDLNCLLYSMESSISKLSRHLGDSSTASSFQLKSRMRAEAIQKYFWDEQTGYFSDYNTKTGRTTRQFSAAGIVPLFFNIATIEQANSASLYLKENLLYPGGIVSTTSNTGQQWDYPNGWAPHQWMAVQGLRNYEHSQLAEEIAIRWLSITEKVFNNTGKMMEKYNVVDLSLTAGGGEYPTQDGFGWTNGVTLALMSLMED